MICEKQTTIRSSSQRTRLMKAALSTALVLLLAAALFAGAASAWSGGSGTAEDPYVITTADDLVLAGHYDNGKYYVLGNDITLTDQVAVTKNVTINGAGHTVDVDNGFNTADYIFHVSRQDGQAENARLNLSGIILECSNLARGINFITFSDPTPASKNVLTNVAIHNSRASGINMNHGVYLEASGLSIDGSGYTISIDIDSKELTATDKNVLVLTDGDSGLKDAIKVKDESAVSDNPNNSIYRIGSVEQTPNAYLKHTTGAGDTDYTGVAWVDEAKVDAGLSENAAKIVEDDKLYLYRTFPEAVGYNAGGETIELLKDVVLGSECEISTSQGLNLAGHNITTTSDLDMFWVHSGAAFTLSDSVGSGKIVASKKVNGNGGCIYVGLGDSDAGTFIMNGGTITDGWANKKGGGVYVTGSGSSFEMNGGCITNCTAAGTDVEDGGGAIYVASGSSFEMNGGNITDCAAKKYGAGVYSKGIFTMTGGSIEDSIAVSGGGVCSFGTFTMSGGSITDCSSYAHGGGIIVCEGIFTMSGGSIINCSTKDGYGGGIYAKSACTLTITDSTISDCKAVDSNGYGGGGICADGTFTMTNSTITNCTAVTSDGGAVSAFNSLTMTDSTIKNCSAEGNGGGVYFYKNTFTMKNSSIADCDAVTGGGIYINSQGILSVSGSTKITGSTNTTGSTNNVYLDGDDKLVLADNLTGKVGIYTPGPTGKFGTAAGIFSGAENFIYDDYMTLAVGKLDSGNLVWTEGRSVTFNPMNGEDSWIEIIANNTNVSKPTPDPVRPGYTFKGWSEDGTNPWDFTTLITENILLNGTWTENPQPAPKKSSSRNEGTSIWLTATPTPVPTNTVPAAEPTQSVPAASPVNPQPAQTTASPVPFAGILAGLSAAAAAAVLRRK